MSFVPLVSTDEDNTIRVVHGGASAADINVALQDYDIVELVGDHSTLDDRIEGAANITLIVRETATVAIDPNASPTTALSREVTALP